MRRRFASIVILACALALSACANAKPAGAAHPSPTRSAVLSPTGEGDVFYAAAQSEQGGIVAVSAQTGKVVRRVAAGEHDGLPVAGIARYSSTRLLITYSKSPSCTSNVAGCGPKPNTCGGEVATLDPATGAIAVLWRVGSDQRLAAAQLSPDRTKVAALASPCVPSYFNDHLVVRRMSDGMSWNIGDHVPRCHALGAPQWAQDSAHVLVSYAPATGAHPYTGGDGTCTSTGDSHLVEIAAGSAQPTIAGPTNAPPTGCTYQALASAGATFYAMQACGPDQSRLQGPASLVQIDGSLKVTRRWPVGDCTDGNDVTASPAQGVLLAAYLFCNPPLAGHKAAQPVTVLDRLNGSTLARIALIPNGGTPYAYVTW